MSVPVAQLLLAVAMAFPGPHGGNLSEAPVEGVISAASTGYRVVGLGDSVPSGFLNDSPSYVTRAATTLAAARHLDPAVDNFAGPGMDSAATLAQVRSDAGARAALAGADLVILQVGANDFVDTDADDPRCVDTWACYGNELGTLRTDLDATLKEVRSLSPEATVLVVGYWNVWKDGSAAQGLGETYRAVAANLTLATNGALHGAADAVGARYLDSSVAMDSTGDRDALLLEDGDHPDAEGHEAIARAVVAAVGAKPGQK